MFLFLRVRVVVLCVCVLLNNICTPFCRMVVFFSCFVSLLLCVSVIYEVREVVLACVFSSDDFFFRDPFGGLQSRSGDKPLTF